MELSAAKEGLQLQREWMMKSSKWYFPEPGKENISCTSRSVLCCEKVVKFRAMRQQQPLPRALHRTVASVHCLGLINGGNATPAGVDDRRTLKPNIMYYRLEVEWMKKLLPYSSSDNQSETPRHLRA
ncbi:hypothetical protein Droror1_Dr00014043 [Drosera rotundifolia]